MANPRNSPGAKRLHRQAIALFKRGERQAAAKLAIESGQCASHVTAKMWLRWAGTIWPAA